MRLFLSSWYLRHEQRFDALRPKSGRGRAGIVLNAGGYSSRVCVVTPGLDGIHLVDDPSVLPPGYASNVEPSCAELVPFRILPHWRSDHPESEMIDRAAAHLSEAGLEYRCLRDGQALVVQDDEVTLDDL